MTDKPNAKTSSPNEAAKKYLPTGFYSDSKYAGALDRVDPALGLMGWAIRLDDVAQQVQVEARCGKHLLATSFAALPRPDIDKVLGQKTECLFVIRWGRFDKAQLEQLIAEGDEVVEIFLPSAGSYVATVCNAVRVSTIRESMDRHLPVHLDDDLNRLTKLEAAHDRQRAAADPAPAMPDGGEAPAEVVETAASPEVTPDPADAEDLEVRATEAATCDGEIVAIDLKHGISGWAIELGAHHGSVRVDAVCDDRPIGWAFTTPMPLREGVAPPSYTCAELAFTPARFDRSAVESLLATRPDGDARIEFRVGSLTLASRQGVAPTIADVAALLREGDVADPASLGEQFQVIAESHTFDPTWYVETYPDIGQAPINPLFHYLVAGEAEGRRPSYYFDQTVVGETIPVAAPGGPTILFTYLTTPGLYDTLTGIHFDGKWHRRAYELPETQNPLSHFMKRKQSTNPNAYFDVKYYVTRYPDVAGVPDKYVHFAEWGVREKRFPSPNFNPIFYYQTYLAGRSSENAFYHFLTIGRHQGVVPVPTQDHLTGASQVRLFSDPGEHFEAEQVPLPPGITSDIKTFAFYLAQFHAIPENDLFWGTGFTEWRNIARGQPRFAGHYQPRVPRDLGFYNLTDPDAIRRQVASAVAAGITGFCYYFYWFNGRRVLERPLDAFVADPQLQMPFCLLWANENWTRRWDGQENDVLLRQDYDPAQDEDLAACLAGYMQSNRYYRIGGRPLFFIYRPGIIPNAREFFDRLRAALTAKLGVEPIIFQTQAFGDNDPRVYGLDGAVEFPPHKLANHCQDYAKQQHVLDWNFSGQVFRYDEFVNASLSEPPSEFPLIKTVIPMWDNDARKQGAGLCVHGSTPRAFGDWFSSLCEQARKTPVFGEKLVFINAWNEWCEGTYLEPDVHHGWAYLNELTRRLDVAASADARSGREKIVLVGHDAFPSGAQFLLLSIAKQLKFGFGIDIVLLLLGDGELLDQYRQCAEVHVLGSEDPSAHLTRLKRRGYTRALVNTSASGRIVPWLKQHDFTIVALVHELPALIAAYHLQESCERIVEHADKVVFAADYVRQGLSEVVGRPIANAVVRPQGLYAPVGTSTGDRDIKRELGLSPDTRVVLGVGYADLRKGIDVFASFARQYHEAGETVAFIWAGALDPSIARWIGGDVVRRTTPNMHLVGHQKDVRPYFAAADALFLSSREDPFPTVVLEALAAGIGVIGFEACGGFNELLEDRRLGRSIPFGDFKAFHDAFAALSERETRTSPLAEIRRNIVRDRFNWRDYCFDLVQMLNPSVRKLSVVVPNYNYAHHLEQRLAGIFAQTYPIYELIVLDDASSDDSLAVIERVRDGSGRHMTVIPNEKNSGSVFRQWRAGLQAARGDLLWIAEADDDALPDFAERLCARLVEDNRSLLAFSDSGAIDEIGDIMYESYKGYYSEFGDHGLDESGRFPAHDFLKRFLAVRNCILNVSAVVWRAEALRQAFERLGERAFALRCGGDWQIYVEACREGGVICYEADALNRHRRHKGSVTGALSQSDHLVEIRSVHDAVREILGGDEAVGKSIMDFERMLAAKWNMEAPA